jgi:RecA/RadA recombinase
MAKPFDISKFRKNLTKNITGISTGFNDPDLWVSTGSYGLNYLISGNFYRGVPMGKVTVFAGESGAGKSYIVSGNLVKNAQDQGIFVVLIDTENALDEKWLHALGVETTEDKLLRISATMIDDVAKIINDFVTEYKANYMDIPKAERPKIMFVVDSIGMLLTPTEINQFQAGDMKGDMGRKAKQLKALVSNCVNMFGDLNIGMVVTNHTYASQDMFDPDDKISGGSGFIFASSIVVAMKKYKLKEDEEGNKVSDVTGIRATCKVVKTRYSKPFESIKLDIPWETGMNPLSGLFDLFEKSGVLVKEGNRYKYVTKAGVEMKMYRKEWSTDETSMKVIMDEFTQDDLKLVIEEPADERIDIPVVQGETV